MHDQVDRCCFLPTNLIWLLRPNQGYYVYATKCCDRYRHGYIIGATPIKFAYAGAWRELGWDQLVGLHDQPLGRLGAFLHVFFV
jgi:hypothetical protein